MSIAKLTEIADYEKRLTSIESLLKYIPREILQEAKQRAVDSKSFNNC